MMGGNTKNSKEETSFFLITNINTALPLNSKKEGEENVRKHNKTKQNNNTRQFSEAIKTREGANSISECKNKDWGDSWVKPSLCKNTGLSLNPQNQQKARRCSNKHYHPSAPKARWETRNRRTWKSFAGHPAWQA